MNKKCLAFGKNGKAFGGGNGDNANCQSGPTLENRQRGTTSDTKLRLNMKKILTLSVAIMAVSALSATAADAKATYEKLLADSPSKAVKTAATLGLQACGAK